MGHRNNHMDPRNNTINNSLPPQRGDLSRPQNSFSYATNNPNGPNGPSAPNPLNSPTNASSNPLLGTDSRPDPSLMTASERNAAQQSAAANVIRSRIDALFGNPHSAQQPAVQSAQQPVQQPVQQPAQQPAQQLVAQLAQNTLSNTSEIIDTNPYDRTHSIRPQPQAEQWKAYHSAWQNYYQKYYAGFYAQQAAQTAGANNGVGTPEAAQGDAGHQQHPLDSYFSAKTDQQVTSGSFSKDQALYELRQKLLSKVRSRAKKVRKSRHFIPIMAGLAVMLIFAFLQYNQVLFGSVYAYVAPGSVDPQNIVIDPSETTAVTDEPRLIIPKINVDVPVLYDVGSDYDSQMAAMQKGVAHFAIPGADSHPGEIGNTVLSGHSSNDLFDPGDYKFIFAQLEKMQKGDTIYANYKGTRYTYVITGTEVVTPQQVSKLVYTTNKPILTLITCTPLGTSKNRLLVTAEQISPDPAKSAPAKATSTSSNTESSIPGGSTPTLLERLFGAR